MGLYVMMYDDLKKALDILQAMEATTRQTMELQGATHGGTNKITTKPEKIPCYRCGGKRSPNDCRYKDQQCNK